MLFEFGSRKEIIMICMNFGIKLFYSEIGGHVMISKFCKGNFGKRMEADGESRGRPMARLVQAVRRPSQS